MMIIHSKYQPFLTLDYMVSESENKLFDRKSSKVKASDIAPIISAFANGDGGTIVIGIEDKTRKVEGINGIGTDSINNLIATPKDVCVPMPQYKEEFVPVINSKREELIASEYKKKECLEYLKKLDIPENDLGLKALIEEVELIYKNHQPHVIENI